MASLEEELKAILIELGWTHTNDSKFGWTKNSHEFMASFDEKFTRIYIGEGLTPLMRIRVHSSRPDIAKQLVRDWCKH